MISTNDWVSTLHFVIKLTVNYCLTKQWVEPSFLPFIVNSNKEAKEMKSMGLSSEMTKSNVIFLYVALSCFQKECPDWSSTMAISALVDTARRSALCTSLCRCRGEEQRWIIISIQCSRMQFEQVPPTTSQTNTPPPFSLATKKRGGPTHWLHDLEK